MENCNNFFYKIKRTQINKCVLFQTCMTLCLLCNTKVDILKNISVLFVPEMKAGSRVVLDPNDFHRMDKNR